MSQQPDANGPVRDDVPADIVLFTIVVVRRRQIEPEPAHA